MNNAILFIISLISISVCAILDASFASFAAGIFILITGVLFCFTVNRSYRNGAFKTLFSVVPVYVSIAYIFSLSFSQNRFFAVSDSMRYLEYYQNSTEYFRGWYYLIETYKELADNNGLFNSYIQCWATIGNLHLGGSTVFYMTLAQTLFGVLCSIILYRIISKFHTDKPVSYTVTFSCCSLFLFYSSVIIRDITAAFFFLFALDYLMQEFKVRRLFLLVLFAFCVWGIRLYSGLFYFVFPISYIVLKLSRGTGKQGTLILSAILGAIMLPIIMTSAIGEQTQEEIEGYEEYSAGRNENGLFTKLSKLPPGIKQLSLTLFSQISPFPPQNLLLKAKNFSQSIMGLNHIVYEFFWFFIVYMLAYLCIINGKYKLLKRNESILLMISLLYIVVNTAHPDIRRMMPVYPIIYLVNLNIQKRCSLKEVSEAKRKLRLLYVILLIFAIIYRG